MSFRVGQKVVCVDTWPRYTLQSWWYEFRHPYKSPVKDQIYTISNLYWLDGDEYVELAELPSPATEFWNAGFYACGFRPVVERKTDISIFEKMLTPQREDA